MVTGVLFLMLALLALLLVTFIYQIVTTPVAAVDAPTLVRSAAAPPAPAPVLPARQPRAGTFPAGSRPARGTARPGAARGLRSRGAAGLTIGGLAALVIGGWLFLRIAHGAVACSPRAIEVCSQGFVLLTGTQLAGAAIAVAGVVSVVVAIVLAQR
jgi:hypothetical protein